MPSSPENTTEALYRHPLDAIFKPRNIAVIGATDNPASVGYIVLSNLLQNASPHQQIYPVNPKRQTVMDLPAYPKITAVPETVDLAVIITPARTVPGIIRDCAKAGVKGAIIISAGFKEIGPTGAALEQEILSEARRSGIRLIGPNCLGVMNPYGGLNATFAADMARPGNVAFISQSGAFCTSILDWSLQEQVGFSAFVSIGSMLDVNWGDLISYFGQDYRTKSIVIYMESIGEAHAFLAAARKVALNKPIIVLKAGRTEAAAKAATSHTGALAGSDEVLDAAFQRVGVLRVDTVTDLFAMAEILAKQPRPKGPRLTILTNAGGPGVLATDALIANGGQLAELSPQTMTALNAVLPRHWSHSNPIDIIGDADLERYSQAVEIASQEPNSDGLLVLLTPQEMTNPTQTAQAVKKMLAGKNKPVLASWMGGAAVTAGDAILDQANIPTFSYPDTAAKAFSYMWRYQQNLQSLYETPALSALSQEAIHNRTKVEQIIQVAQQAKRTLLTELESKQILAAYDIPSIETQLAINEIEAVERAEKIGYPVVLKLHSHTITHKSDVGGVQLNLADAAAVRKAYRAIENGVAQSHHSDGFDGVTVQPMVLAGESYELILGSSLDPQFGPVLLFGSGGQLVEVFKDRALGLPPLNSTLARRMIEQTKVATALKGVRGRQPVDMAALEQLLVRFSHLVVDQPWIKEIDINPLLVNAERLIALDARVVLHPPDTGPAALSSVAIRPYPIQYITKERLPGGTPLTIRPIRAEDEPLMVTFHKSLSEESVYTRFFSYLPLNRRITHERLSRICFVDYDDEMAIVAEHHNADTAEPELLGVARLLKLGQGETAEFSILVSDAWQGQGVGVMLMTRLIEIARQEGYKRLYGPILPENHAMQRLCRKLGFTINRSYEENLVQATFELE